MYGRRCFHRILNHPLVPAKLLLDRNRRSVDAHRMMYTCNTSHMRLPQDRTHYDYDGREAAREASLIA